MTHMFLRISLCNWLQWNVVCIITIRYSFHVVQFTVCWVTYPWTNADIVYVRVLVIFTDGFVFSVTLILNHISAPVPSDLGSIAEQDIYRIKDLAKDSGIKSTNPIIVVRVLCKSRMLHYSKPNKNDKWPFQVTENPHPARFIRWTFLPLNLKQSIDNDCFGEVSVICYLM